MPRKKPIVKVAGYEDLDRILLSAYAQASQGKGKERHGNGLPFAEQPMQRITDQVGLGFTLGQVTKKIWEAKSLMKQAAIHELLGAINYVAGTILWIENNWEDE